MSGFGALVCYWASILNIPEVGGPMHAQFGRSRYCQLQLHVLDFRLATASAERQRAYMAFYDNRKHLHGLLRIRVWIRNIKPSGDASPENDRHNWSLQASISQSKLRSTPHCNGGTDKSSPASELTKRANFWSSRRMTYY